MSKYKILNLLTAYTVVICCISGCGSSAVVPAVNGGSAQSGSTSQDTSAPQSASVLLSDQSVPAASQPKTYRDNTPVCLVPTADGTAETHNDVASIDYSHSQDGYVCADYTGTCPKVKLRITGPDAIVYTYDLHENGYETFPLSSGSGSYEITIYENISGQNYSTCLYEKIEVSIADEFAPYLYPNQYVNFNADSKTVAKGSELVAAATTDLEAITNIYDYITASISYDYDMAADPPTGYTTDIDATLASGKGICLDYAAVMASMLRSQRIPTRLEVGYAKDAYHAWISVYTESTGWLNGIIEFDADTWTLVDPTFGANSSDRALKKFIGDGSNYTLQKIY